MGRWRNTVPEYGFRISVVSVVVVAGLVLFRLVLFLELFFFRFAVASEVSVSRSNTKHTVIRVGRRSAILV